MGRGRPRIRRALLVLLPCLAAAQVPDGFEPIFNGRNLAGWHMSLTNHHGDTDEWRIFEGALVGKQDKPGNGGILLTDKTYTDFEISLEMTLTSGASSRGPWSASRTSRATGEFC